MFVTPSDAPLTMKWKEAMDYAAKLDAHGRKDWRLPSEGELNVLFNNLAAIGGFKITGLDKDWYWSASEERDWVVCQRFSDGCQARTGKGNGSSVRCVRS